MTADVWSGEWLMPMKNSQENKINTCFCESPHVRAKSTRQKSRIFNFKSPEPGERGSSLLALYKSCSWMVHTCRTEAKGRIPKMQIKTDIHSRFTTLSNGDKWINRLDWGPLSFNWHQGIYHKEDSAFWPSRTFSRTVTGGHWSSLLYKSLEPALCDQWKIAKSNTTLSSNQTFSTWDLHSGNFRHLKLYAKACLWDTKHSLEKTYTVYFLENISFSSGPVDWTVSILNLYKDYHSLYSYKPKLL